jgi:DEAD/DEAH box helicase domain-containing protein
MDATAFLRDIRHRKGYEGQVVHVENIKPRDAQFADLSPPLPDIVAEALREQGIEQLYTHQAQAVEAVRAGGDVCIVTGTASGKTLCYNIPVLEMLISDPLGKACFLFPTKALAQDQLRGIHRLQEAAPKLPITAGTYDGDTPQSMRRQLREDANIILTNPDMLHAGVLPNHARWAHFFSNLRYVVVDEIHTYRGVFGSNVSNVLRRMNRVCAHYDCRPQYICCSATIANPAELA